MSPEKELAEQCKAAAEEITFIVEDCEQYIVRVTQADLDKWADLLWTAGVVLEKVKP